MRLKLNRGTISVEIMGHENDGLTFFYSAKMTYELIRVITSSADIFINEPGIFRISLLAGTRTELINLKGESVINGQRIKNKRKAITSEQQVFVGEWDSKNEDSFDLWGRERADKSIKANKSLKKDAPWAAKRKEGQQTLVEFPYEEEDQTTRRVVSAKPGFVNFFEAGVQVSRPNKDWEQLNYEWQFEAGDKLRTSKESFAELSVLPDMYLRLDTETEITLEQLSNELILVKLVRGAAILDVARYEVKELLPIRLSGLTTSVDIVGEGLYRIDVRPGREQIEIREGKALLNKTTVSGCRIISGETVSKCDETRTWTDKFNAWSQWRGEGKFFFFRRTLVTGPFMQGLRRRRFRNTGFWFQVPGRTDYTFVPFTSPRFRSPYGGNYSTVLAPPGGPMIRPVVTDRPLRRTQGPPTAMP